MKKLIIIVMLGTIILTGCGNIDLGTVHWTDKTQQQAQLDRLECTHNAELAASSGGHQVGNFFLGLTIVGAPLAHVNDTQTERDVYSKCMTEKGYEYTVPQ